MIIIEDDTIDVDMNDAAIRNGASQMADLTLFIKQDAEMPERGLVDLSSDHVRKVLPSLMKDRTTRDNIIWGTDAYVDFGYGCSDRISPDAFRTGIPVRLRARIEKTDSEQQSRTRGKAEVFTPGWICNKMNNHCDSVWFGRDGVFNIENDDGTWTRTEGRVSFPEGKTWKEYVDSRRLEITCGEAPFLVSRYDASTGEPIPLCMRIGMFDRKMRIVDENASSEDEWLDWAIRALQSCYGYEFQGDSLLIARINLLESFVDYSMDRLGHAPDDMILSHAANIISWNLWQMDGLRFCPPYAVTPTVQFDLSMFGSDAGPTAKESVPFHSKIYDWRRDNSVAFIKCRKRGKMDRKIFDYVIGNPPYQEEFTDEGNKTYAAPIYHEFMDAAYEVGEIVELIHPARFLFNAGSTPKAWNQQILNDPHFKVLLFEQDCSKIFPNNDVKGGICISYHDWNGNFPCIETFTPFAELNSLKQKVTSYPHFASLMDHIYIQTRFNLDDLYLDYPDAKRHIGSDGKDRRMEKNIFSKLPEIFTSEPSGDDDVKVLGIINNKRTWKYISSKYVDFSHENLTAYKVLVPTSNGSGAIGEVLSTPLVGTPLVGYTRSFLGICSFDNEREAYNCLKYIKTKFARTCLGILKITQDNNREVWKYVPFQNFASNADIDWSGSVHDIDLQLYRKYNLSDKEIDFIESHVKEME